jgi:hypothetical protein
LSDGGHFEVLGGYELIRRRVPRMIVCDGSADPTYQMGSIANLIRKARIDFDAEITPFAALDYEKLPAGPRKYLGTLDEMRPHGDGASHRSAEKRATLFWVRYPDMPNRRCVLLYIKANVIGDECPDVRHYYRTHSEFPHEPTVDQFFDEEQWESYRWLGEHMMQSLCADGSWFWDIPLEGVQR